MVPITLPNIRATKVLDLVSELRSTGLIINQDFEWAFYQEQIIHNLHDHEIKPRYCEFKFRDPKLATLYALKWQIHLGQKN